MRRRKLLKRDRPKGLFLRKVLTMTFTYETSVA